MKLDRREIDKRIERLYFIHFCLPALGGPLPALMGATGGNIAFCVPIIIILTFFDTIRRPPRHNNPLVWLAINAVAASLPVLLAFWLGRSIPWVFASLLAPPKAVGAHH
jgi:hypothetical protein